MEVLSDQQVDNSRNLPSNKDFLQISCNWQISNNKQFHEAFTTASSSEIADKTNFEDVVSLDTCISLEPIQCNNEPCLLDIKLTNHQRISRIAVVSEAYVLEFFKQFGEYETTVFAEFVDDFEDNLVYFAETAIIPSATEASIKFTKTKNKNSMMWIYGIRLYLTEPINKPKDISTDIFNPEIIKTFLTKLSFNNEETNADPRFKYFLNLSKQENIEKKIEKEDETCNNESTVANIGDITTYIDNKFHDMETRLMKRIDEMEQRTNQKLDLILKRLET